MKQYPPIAIRRHVGAGGFDQDPLEFLAYLKLLLNLKDNQKVWDVGCGYGIVALALENRGWKGTYIGTDIHGPCAGWAAKNISPRNPSFRFIHADIYNQAYWPRGRYNASQWFETFSEDQFDIVLSKSVFTHMLPAELDIYLKQIAGRLKPGGKACLTFFLLNNMQQRLEGQGRNLIQFVRTKKNEVHAVRNARVLTATVAYEETYIMKRLSGMGFIEPKIFYGAWSGIENPVSAQDIIIVQKPPA